MIIKMKIWIIKKTKSEFIFPYKTKNSIVLMSAFKWPYIVFIKIKFTEKFKVYIGKNRWLLGLQPADFRPWPARSPFFFGLDVYLVLMCLIGPKKYLTSGCKPQLKSHFYVLQILFYWSHKVQSALLLWL
jgi:hypothetical protein